MKLEPGSIVKLCPMCKTVVNNAHHFEVELASGFVLGPTCTAECAHQLYIVYQNFWRILPVDTEGQEVC